MSNNNREFVWVEDGAIQASAGLCWIGMPVLSSLVGLLAGNYAEND